MTDRVRLGLLEADLRLGELREGERRVILQEQALCILRMLVERNGELVAREEIRKKLWPNDTVVEFDHSINTAMKKLRQALGDSPDAPSYIGTIPRRGYRLLVPVEWLAAKQPPREINVPIADGTGARLQPEPAVLTGRTVSHYRVLDIIGGGGMGVVYRAEDLKLGRAVALKFLPEELGSDSQALERFSREARAISSLDHTNICNIYEFGEHEGRPFMAMQLLQGQTLRNRLAANEGPLPLQELLDIGIQVSDGLQAAHERGIVHRDIKPANLFLTDKGVCKILDFGVAKLLVIGDEEELAVQLSPPAVESPAAVSGNAHLTRTGSAMGTAGYMSPEQVRGEKLDARTDLFSLGLVLYEMATGQRAFTGETAVLVHNAILNNIPSPAHQLNPELPRWLEAVIDKALEKDREKRYQSAAELRGTVEKAQTNARSKRVTRVRVMATVALVLALLTGYYFRHSVVASKEAIRPALEVQPLTEHGKAGVAAVTRDGNYVAYVKFEGTDRELRLLQVSTDRDVQLLQGSPLGPRRLHFSPDGKFIYFLGRLDPAMGRDTQGLFRIATFGGTVTPLTTDAHAVDPRGGSVTVSPDGKQIAYISQTDDESIIVSVDPDGANRRILARRPIATGFWFIEWSPSQNTIAAVANGSGGSDSMRLVKIELPAGTISDLSGWPTIGQPAWSSDGATIFAPASQNNPLMQIWAINALTGARAPQTSSTTGFSQFSLSATASGDLIANTDAADTTVWVTDHAGQMRSIPSLRGEGNDGAIWVDDRIVTSNTTEMVVHDLYGSNPMKLRSYSNIYRSLAQCGPGQVVYWASNDQYRDHIARTNVSTGLSSALTEGPEDDQPSCSADGKTLVFVHCPERSSRCSITAKSLDSGQSISLYEFDITKEYFVWPALLPDGNVWFRLHRKEDDPYMWMATVPVGGGEIKRVRMPYPYGSWVRWARDGKSMFYVRNENGVGNIWSASFDGSGPRKVTAFKSGGIFRFAVSRDNRLVIVQGEQVNDLVLLKNVKE